MPRDQEQALPSRGPQATVRVGAVTPAPCQALCQEARMTSWICLSSSAWAAGRSSPIGKLTPHILAFISGVTIHSGFPGIVLGENSSSLSRMVLGLDDKQHCPLGVCHVVRSWSESILLPRPL